ncbi:UDP-glucose 6-dehydrogenase TuaD [compost metagenome]
MNVCVIGTGYVGLVTGTCLAYLGHRVVCVDNNSQKIALLEAGKSPIYEPGLESLLDHGIHQGTLTFTMDLAEAVRGAEVVFIAVGTPPLPSGEPDLQYVEAVARGIGAAVTDKKVRVVVNKSTVPIGSGNWVEMLVEDGAYAHRPLPAGNTPLRESDAPRFLVASNPEFLREGSAIGDTLYPDRIVLGAQTPEAVSKLRELYAPLLDQSFDAPSVALRPEGMRSVPLVTTDLASAEMIKYAANAFLATKISFINEVANLCEKVGADVTQVAKGIGLDTRIGSRFLNAGAGWGGSCFGKDVSALISIGREYQYEMEMLKATVSVNSQQRQRLIQKLQEALKILKGKTIGLMGLAFKPNTDDLRDAPALDVARQLIKMGARVKAYDPIAMPHCREQHPDLDVVYAESVDELAVGCDALVLMTEWDEFKAMDLMVVRGLVRTPVFLDARNALSPTACQGYGFHYVGVGR